VTAPHIKDQFEGQNFNWFKDSLMMALKQCRDMYEIVYLLCSNFSWFDKLKFIDEFWMIYCVYPNERRL